MACQLGEAQTSGSLSARFYPASAAFRCDLHIQATFILCEAHARHCGDGAARGNGGVLRRQDEQSSRQAPRQHSTASLASTPAQTSRLTTQLCVLLDFVARQPIATTIEGQSHLRELRYLWYPPRSPSYLSYLSFVRLTYTSTHLHLSGYNSSCISSHVAGTKLAETQLG